MYEREILINYLILYNHKAGKASAKPILTKKGRKALIQLSCQQKFLYYAPECDSKSTLKQVAFAPMECKIANIGL